MKCETNEVAEYSVQELLDNYKVTQTHNGRTGNKEPEERTRTKKEKIIIAKNYV